MSNASARGASRLYSSSRNDCQTALLLTIYGVGYEALGEWIAEQAAHLDAATHRLLTAVREFDTAGGWYKQGARSCAEWLSWRVGWSSSTARDRVRVAQRLGELPMIDDALRRGELSYCKVRALARVATPTNEAALVEMARCSTGAQLDQICRKYAAVQRQGTDPDAKYDAEHRYVSRRELDTGFVEISARLHPDEAAVVWAALDRIVKERLQRREPEGPAEAVAPSPMESAPAAQPAAASRTTEVPRARFTRVDALLELAEGCLRGERPNRAPVDLVVTIPIEELRTPSAEGAMGCYSDGTGVSAETVRRLGCDCGLVVMAEDANGCALSVGRKTRTIPSWLKRALLQRDRKCRFPGCLNQLFVQGHHIEHWAAGGETSLTNLVTLCSHHHRYLHEYGYRVTLDENQEPRFFDARGRLLVEAPSRPVDARSGWPAIRSQNHNLAITAETPACEWDGSPVDYGSVIDALVSVDRERHRDNWVARFRGNDRS